MGVADGQFGRGWRMVGLDVVVDEDKWLGGGGWGVVYQSNTS